MFRCYFSIACLTIVTATASSIDRQANESPKPQPAADDAGTTGKFREDADRVVDGAFDIARGRDRFNALATERFAAWEKADAGDADAIFLVGMCHLTGVGVPRNPRMAMEQFHKSARLGSPHAHVMIGRFAEQGGSADALKFYTAAADANFAWGKYRLGTCYSEGRIVAQDLDRAFQLILSAAEDGLAAAQADVGSRFENGQGTGRDLTKAFEWYSKAADQGDAVGHLNAGFCCLKGIGTTRDAEKARRHLEAAELCGDTQTRELAGRYLRVLP